MRSTLLHVHDADGQVRPLAMTEGAFLPFFSPDGRWVAFFAGDELKKTLVSGEGTPTPLLANIDRTAGASWVDQDRQWW